MYNETIGLVYSTVRVKKMKRKVCILLLILFASGCAAIVGEEKDRPGVITQTDAENIARNYIKNHNLEWGEPWLYKSTFEVYMFTFNTPAREMPSLGPRMMSVNKKTGEVSIPQRM